MSSFVESVDTLFSAQFLALHGLDALTVLAALRGPDNLAPLAEADDTPAPPSVQKEYLTAPARKWMFTENTYRVCAYRPAWDDVPELTASAARERLWHLDDLQSDYHYREHLRRAYRIILRAIEREGKA